MNITKLINQFKLVHGDRYIYGHEMKDNFKIEIFCKSCNDWFLQNIYKHKNGHNCPKCVGGIKLTTSDFVNKSIDKFGNKNCDYTHVIYVNNKTKVKLRCKIHDYIFYQTPQNHLNRTIKSGCKGCPLCSKNSKSDSLNFISSSKKIFGNKYDYSKVLYSNQHSIIELRCKIHDNLFKQKAGNHISGREGCFFCRKNPNCYNKELFILNSNLKHNNKFMYDRVIFKSIKEEVLIGCTKHGYFNISAISHLRGKKCPKCVSSNGEFKIINFLEEKNLLFVHQKKFDLCRDKNTLRFDFYLPKLNLIIEYDGKQHYANSKSWGGDVKFQDIIKKDEIKNKYCFDNQLRLIRIPYWEINNIEKILKKEIFNEN